MISGQVDGITVIGGLTAMILGSIITTKNLWLAKALLGALVLLWGIFFIGLWLGR